MKHRHNIGGGAVGRSLSFYLQAVAVALVLGTIGTLFSAVVATAADTPEEWARAREGLGYRLDVDYLYERLSPNDLYGDWHTLRATLYVKTMPRVTPFISTGLYEREWSNGLVTLGAYMEWTSRLYTYSAWTRGGSSEYLVKNRFDHFFHLGTGNITWGLGGGWMEDWHEHEDWYLAAGPRWWKGLHVAEYRLMRSASDPGNQIAWNHLVSFGRGSEGHSWLFLTFEIGEEQYLATWVTPYQEVHHAARGVTLSYQKWLRPTWGVKGQLGYLDLGEEGDGYEKVAVGGGVFIEW